MGEPRDGVASLLSHVLARAPQADVGAPSAGRIAVRATELHMVRQWREGRVLRMWRCVTERPVSALR